MPVFDSSDPRTMLPPPITRPTRGAGVHHRLNSSANRFDRVEVVAEALVSGEGFAGELEQNAWIVQLGHG